MISFCENCDKNVYAETEDDVTYVCPCCSKVLEEIEYVYDCVGV